MSLCSVCGVAADQGFNRYWTKGGVESFGAKAAKDLEVTRGKSFRHEKTKKKRGSYVPPYCYHMHSIYSAHIMKPLVRTTLYHS